VSAPSPAALTAVNELLRGLSSARQVHALYPAGHPNRGQSVRDLVHLVHDLRDASGTDPVVFCTRNSFYLGPTLLARESLSLFRLVEAFEAAGIRAVELLADVSQDDLSRLVDIINGDSDLEPVIGGIVLNRIRPTIATGPAQDLDLSEMRRAYAVGLEVLRQTAMRVMAGREVDLEAATKVVDQLADEVMADPGHALLLTTVKSYDEYTYFHMLNVCLLSIALGQAVGLRRDQVTALGLGGLLHDVGKVQMPHDVLTHVGRLSEEQWRLIQRHPVDGAGLVFRTGDGLYHPAASVVLEHHAAYDLGGYPDLTERPRPSIAARLVSVADCFDAVTSKRAYRAASSRREALEILQSGSGRGFDPRIVRLFTALLGLFPVGSMVRLDSGELALITRNHEQLLARPTVLVVLDDNGNPVDPEERDLTTVRPDGTYRWSVTQAVDPERLGIDVMEFLTTGELTSPQPESPGGLVHEPSHGEREPEGYVDTHNEPGGHHHHLPDGGHIDPDVHAPLEEDALDTDRRGR
jgi:HD-GYP domain-containing protein (c-di-GMP phosphodiesterase class II)